MRKSLAILLLTSYMLCAFGISFSFHHCKGELKYVNIHSEKKKTCCKGRKMPKNCCQTIKVAFKKSDDQGQSFFTLKLKSPEPVKAEVLFADASQPAVLRSLLREEPDYRLRPPPLLTATVPLYITYSVYRI